MNYQLYLVLGMGLQCSSGIKTYNTKKMLSCGLGDNSTIKECHERSKVCEVYHLWIEGINEKPLSLYNCGAENKLLDQADDGKCNPICEKSLIQILSKTMGRILKNYATEYDKLSDSCIKEISSIESGSKVYRTDTTSHVPYCEKIEDLKQCKPKTTPSKTNQPTEPSFSKTMNGVTTKKFNVISLQNLFGFLINIGLLLNQL